MGTSIGCLLAMSSGHPRNVILPGVHKRTPQPHPQSNFTRLDLTPHDFAGDFFLDLIRQLSTIETNLWNTVNFL